MPSLSVVIPTRNTRELTLRCLASLQSATGDLQIVVVDEASQDGTGEAIRQRFPGVELIERDSPGGFSAAVNQGASVATGEVLLLLNSDTEVDSGALAVLREGLDRNPRLGVAGARLRYPDGQPQWSGGKEPTRLWLLALASGFATALGKLRFWRRLRPPSGSSPGDTDLTPLPVEWVTGAALAVRRGVWEEYGPLDEGYRFYAQDLDLCGRARAAGWKVAILPGFDVLHHHGATLAAESSGAHGDVKHQRFDLLWPDLVRWCAKSRGEKPGRSAAGSLLWGGVLRLVGRRLASPVAGAARRQRWREESVFLRRALTYCLSVLRGGTAT